MADAKLSIEIKDTSGAAHTPGAPSSPAERAADAAWVAAAEARSRAETDYYRRAARVLPAGGLPAGASPSGGPPAGNTPPGVPAPSAPTSLFPPRAVAGRAWSDLDFDAKRRAALNGRPEGVTDNEWTAYGRENARRGAGIARISGRASAEAQRRREEQEEEARTQAAQDARTFARAQERRERARAAEAADRAEAEARTVDRQRRIGGAVGGAAAELVRGGGAGRYVGGGLGSMAGEAIGGRFGGPAGAAAGARIGQAVGEKVGGVVDDPFSGAASSAARVARGDGTGVVTGAAGGIGSGLTTAGAALGPLGAPLMVLGQGIKVAGDAVGKVKEVADAFASRGREISGYNGQISSAAAMQDLARTLSDINEAQQLGGGYTKLIEAQTRFEESLKSALLPLKEEVLKYLPMMLDIMLQGISNILRAIDQVWKNEIVKKMADNLDKTRAALEGPRAGVLPMIDSWITAAAGLRLPGLDGGAVGVPPLDADRRPLPAVPILAGVP